MDPNLDPGQLEQSGLPLPSQPEPKKSPAGLMVAILGAALVIMAIAGGIIAYTVSFAKGDNTSEQDSTSAPKPTEPVTGPGKTLHSAKDSADTFNKKTEEVQKQAEELN